MTTTDELSQLKEQLGYFFMLFNASANDDWNMVQTTHSILTSVDVLLTLTKQHTDELKKDISTMYASWENAELYYEKNIRHKQVRLEMSRIMRRCFRIAAENKLIKLTKDVYLYAAPQQMISQEGSFMGGGDKNQT